MDAVYFSGGQDLNTLDELAERDLYEFEELPDSKWPLFVGIENFNNIWSRQFRRRNWYECKDRTWHFEYLQHVPLPLPSTGTQEDFVPACFSLSRRQKKLTIFGGAL